MNNNQNSSHFSSSFLFGLIIGAGIVFFLGTKKGKQILKTITEEGMELSELFNDEDIIDEEFEEPVPCENCEREKKSEVENHPPHSKTNGSGALTKIKKVHHFFKGIPRRRS